MKLNALFFTLLFGLAAVSAQADPAVINGVDRDGWGGVYQIDGPAFDNGNYWWMCMEPNGSPSATISEGFIADAITLLDGWDQQNTTRQNFFINDPSANPALQVRVIEYVLDTYLPWNLVGASNRFLEQSSNSSLFGTNDDFYNAFFTVQHFIEEAYGKGNMVDFTDMSEFLHDSQPGDVPWNGGNAAGNIDAFNARMALFNSILNDVENKAGIAGFFENYNVQGTYIVANTLFPEGDDGNWQDALIILAPVPEPSGALLIACAGIVVMFRRFRRLAA
ncbi:hypothetical protein [Brevifollis gellanilyticus]|uniref:PEP-CTERM protein-sorting domain-containing protein n=1 Tax=Brevifollis gellanilyticus TaxID=748831 RepID=A0A512MCX7_9BACT|nr:hypothetical protein [Brevifollis gellanilyticus]GEP44594.1 hypothetical protein BGE01nite_38850 [Brevifollis gellanilyticus]